MKVAPGLRPQDFTTVNDHQLIAVNHRALVVYRADAIGIAVERDA